ncbi:L-galactose dehydrogenase-like protein, partial [Dinothrombium tinctorium]
ALESIPRKAYYIASKVGRTHNCEFDYSSKAVLQTFEESLRRLKLDYLDVLHVHDVEFADSNILLSETLPTLDKLRTEGKIRYIAINGYPLDVLRDVIEKSAVKIDIVQSYCRCTPFDNSLLEYIPFFQKNEVGIINAAPLGMGLLTTNKVPSWHPAKMETIKACEEAAQYCTDHGGDISRIAVNHAFEIDGIATHLIGLNNVKLLRKHLDLLKNGLTENERKIASEIKKIFDKLTVRDWEGVELAKYKKNKFEFENYLRQQISPEQAIKRKCSIQTRIMWC